MSSAVLTEIIENDTVAVVTLNRPEARNAIDADLGRALPEAIRRCDAIDTEIGRAHV